MTHPTFAAFVVALLDEAKGRGHSAASIAAHLDQSPSLLSAWRTGRAKPSNAHFGKVLAFIDADTATCAEGWALLGVPDEHLAQPVVGILPDAAA
jgi:hypothetical protein